MTGGAAVRHVLVVSKTHLDVGFTDTAAAVRRRYLEDFFPRALRTAAELRDVDGVEWCWTTGSWILTEALEAADAPGRRRLEAAVAAGQLTWHALPFTMHTEYADSSLVEHGLSLSERLDRWFGRRTRAAKVTDVPGHTRGLVGLLADAGVELLHIGGNPASDPVRVPRQFRWRSPGGAEVAVIHQPGSYGAEQVVAGSDVLVAVDLTGDNLGPPDAATVRARTAELRAAHPDASLRHGTLDDVAAVVGRHLDELPVLDGELGDAWLHGVASDPVKTAAFRELSRLRRRWVRGGALRADDPALHRASTRLLLVAEHTWGLDQKTHWPDTDHWSAAELARVLDEPSTARFAASWDEQRHLLDEFVDELRRGGRDGHARAAAQALAAVRAPLAELDRWRTLAELDPSEPVRVGGCTVRVDPRSGAVVGLVDAAGREWCDPAVPLARFRILTAGAADYERWFATYNRHTRAEDLDWARWDNTKPGLERSGAVSATWATRCRGVRRVATASGEALVVDLDGPHPAGGGGAQPPPVGTDPDAPVAWPARLHVVVRPGGDDVELQLLWGDLPAARWPQSAWWSISPAVADPHGWTMTKLDEPVRPDEVTDHGRSIWHVAQDLRHPEGPRVELLDAGLVSPGEPAPLHWLDEPADPTGGWHLCLHANLWGTNFPMWAPGDARFRVRLGWGGLNRPG